MSRKILEHISTLSGLIAIVALVFSVYLFLDQLNLIQRSREASATDSCYVIRSAIQYSFHDSAEATQLLSRLGLGNCVHYGLKVTSLTHHATR